MCIYIAAGVISSAARLDHWSPYNNIVHDVYTCAWFIRLYRNIFFLIKKFFKLIPFFWNSFWIIYTYNIHMVATIEWFYIKRKEFLCILYNFCKKKKVRPKIMDTEVNLWINYIYIRIYFYTSLLCNSILSICRWRRSSIAVYSLTLQCPFIYFFFFFRHFKAGQIKAQT